mmetsp:Transcript_27728/g.77534  ORF Transcript_27728/g.77534 Transcript_27728/m.77534 type:complete len:90 (+) Transcript_27728:564-833(+)
MHGLRPNSTEQGEGRQQVADTGGTLDLNTRQHPRPGEEMPPPVRPHNHAAMGDVERANQDLRKIIVRLMAERGVPEEEAHTLRSPSSLG